MGRVFRFDEIKQGQVPTSADFDRGRQDIVETFEASDEVVGAIICGSIIHGTYNLRSDVDAVVYHRDTQAARQLLADLRRRNADRNLKVNLVPIRALPAVASTPSVTGIIST